MKKTPIVGLLLVLAGFAVSSRADIVADLVSDGGFEGLDAAGFEPSTSSSPWFTDESVKWALQTETNIINSGSQAVVWQYYANQPNLMQNLGVQIQANTDYEVNLWHALGEASGTVAHSNSPSFNVAIWVSDTVDGTYTYAAGKFGILADSTDGEYDSYTGVYTAAKLENHVGKYMQLRFVKPNSAVTHRIFVDDVSFGIVIPEPATIGLIALFGTSLIALRRFISL